MNLKYCVSVAKVWAMLLSLGICGVLGINGMSANALDVTSKITLLGNPFTSRYPSGDVRYARNVWDMQVFEGRIYLASGNSANNAPAPNAGPVDLWYYDTSLNGFVKEVTLLQEAVERFRVMNNKLYIPGRDPKNNTTTDEALYIRNKSGWSTVLQSNFYHCGDILATTTSLITAISPTGTDALRVSSNGGASWREIKLAGQDGTLPYVYCSGFYTLFWLGGQIYVSGDLFSLDKPDIFTATKGVANQIARIDSNLTTATAITTTTLDTMFPGVDLTSFSRIFRPLDANGTLVCIAATDDNGGQTFLPLGLYVVRANAQGTAIHLTDNALPWDIMSGDDGRVYVLGAIAGSGGHYTVTVSSSAVTDLTSWREDFRFQADSFARSFEFVGGNFYFGLGCSTSVLSDASGNILMYGANAPTTDVMLSDFVVSEVNPIESDVNSLVHGKAVLPQMNSRNTSD